MHKYHLILALTLFFPFLGNTQDCISYFRYSKDEISQVKLCPEAMKSDIKQLHEHILETHPNPSLYCGVEAFVAGYKKALASCSSEKTMIEFIQIVNAYLAVMKDSHTNLNPRDYLYLGPKDRAVLPFFVVRINGRFYLQSMYKNNIPVGSEILQVDSYSMDSLFAVSKRLSFTEGNAAIARDEIAEKMIGATFNLLHRANLTDIANFKIVNLQGDTVVVKAHYAKSSHYLKGRNIKLEGPIHYFIDKDNRCVLTIESFDNISLKKFKKQIDACFKEIKRKDVQELFIDLRDNLGGMLRAQEYVLSYLNQNGTSLQMNYLYKRSHYDRFASLPFYQEWQFTNRAERVYPNGLISQEYDFYKSPLGTTRTILYDYTPKNNLNYRYKGKCTLITNGSSMSASVLFAGWFKSNNRGEIIGTQCMGGIGGTFGNSAPYLLDHSNIHLMVSTLKFTPKALSQIELNAIEPDHVISIDLQQLIKQQDPVLEYLNIRKDSKKKVK
jgi:C-terminal processing protease CtpA/Prc